MTGKRWTTEELDFVRANEGLLSIAEIAEALNRPGPGTRAKLIKLGIAFRDTRGEAARKALTTWTPEKLDELRELAKEKTSEELAEYFGLEYGGIRDVMYRYQIPGRGVSRQHSPEEIEKRASQLRGREKVDFSVSRVCVKCNTLKQPEEFPDERNAGSKTCRKCRSERNCANIKKNLEYWRLKKYNLTIEQAIVIYESQNGLCPICDKPLDLNKKKFHVDHDHRCCSHNGSCGKCVRGFLHDYCNRLVGWYEKAFELGYVESITAYLANPI